MIRWVVRMLSRRRDFGRVLVVDGCCERRDYNKVESRIVRRGFCLVRGSESRQKY